MYGLFLETERCPDGVELTTFHSGELYFRDRTDRRVPLRVEILTLENPTVVDFVNAREDADLVRFFSKFGLLLAMGPMGPLGDFGQMPPFHDYDAVIRARKQFRDLLISATGPDHADALRAINERSNRLALELLPIFDLASESGAVRMLLKCDDLWPFMFMEIAMVATNGAKLATCKQCGKVFLTGPLTWRRSRAQYCTDRCRVAAMRVRNKANAGTQEG